MGVDHPFGVGWREEGKARATSKAWGGLDREVGLEFCNPKRG